MILPLCHTPSESGQLDEFHSKYENGRLTHGAIRGIGSTPTGTDGKVEEGEHESRTYSQNQREVSEKKLTYLILNFLLVKYVVPVNIL